MRWKGLFRITKQGNKENAAELDMNITFFTNSCFSVLILNKDLRNSNTNVHVIKMIKKNCFSFSDRAGNLKLMPWEIMYLYGFDFEKATELSKFLFFSEYTNSLKNYFMLLWLKKKTDLEDPITHLKSHIYLMYNTRTQFYSRRLS